MINAKDGQASEKWARYEISVKLLYFVGKINVANAACSHTIHIDMGTVRSVPYGIIRKGALIFIYHKTLLDTCHIQSYHVTKPTWNILFPPRSRMYEIIIKTKYSEYRIFWYLVCRCSIYPGVSRELRGIYISFALRDIPINCFITFANHCLCDKW